MTSGRKIKKRPIYDLLFFFISVSLTVTFFICFLSIKNDCIFIENEIRHLKSIKKNHTSKLKILSSKVKKLSRQDRIEKIAGEKFNLHIPSPESLIVFMGEGYD